MSLENRYTYSFLFTGITPSPETLSITFQAQGQDLRVIIKFLFQFESFGVRQERHVEKVYSDTEVIPSKGAVADLTINI